MKKIISLLCVVIVMSICPKVNSEKYCITISLTDKDGIVLLTDKNGTREMPCSFETDEIVFKSYPYATIYSLKSAKIIIIPKDLRMLAIIEIKPEEHNEFDWTYSIHNSNNAYIEDKVLKRNEIDLPLSQKENFIDVSCWIEKNKFELFRIDFYELIYIKLK